jgi:hypothetical protein
VEVCSLKYPPCEVRRSGAAPLSTSIRTLNPRFATMLNFSTHKVINYQTPTGTKRLPAIHVTIEFEISAKFMRSVEKSRVKLLLKSIG